LQRAHKTVDERLPTRSQQVTLQALDDARLRTIVDRYVDAWERGDVESLVAMLTDDATMSMPPRASWYRGRDAVASFLARAPLDGSIGWRCTPTRANGQLAFAHYRVDLRDGTISPYGLTIVTLRGAQIEALTAFLMPELFARFGLPATLA
jgi:RNA polymerase sigma-70 factor (ECF subfamily)